MISYLLHLANTSPPRRPHRDLFYAMKLRLLQRYANPDGYDIQHIPGKRCFGCGGTGIHYYLSGDEDYCWKCGGSGWWKSPKWVVLKRWRFGRYVFHTPENVSYTEPDPKPINTIVGYVKHCYIPGHWCEEATLWLALLFDWGLLRSLMREGTTYCRWPRWFGPMVQAMQISGMSRRLIRSMQMRCDTCGFHTWSVFVSRCTRCEAIRDAARTPEDIPF